MTMRLKEEQRLKAEAEDEAVDRYNRQQDAKAERREEEAAAAAAEATMRISPARGAGEGVGRRCAGRRAARQARL